jgi:predicted ATPase
VFAGSFSLPAAEAIGAGSPDRGESRPVMDTLGALVDSSLVRPQTRRGEPRFALLETIRQYALDRLREGGEWTEAHDRHAGYFLALAEPADADLTGPGQLAWLDRLETEHDNLFAAMSWLAGSKDLPPDQQAMALTQAGAAFATNGDLARAQQVFERACRCTSRTTNGWRRR